VKARCSNSAVVSARDFLISSSPPPPTVEFRRASAAAESSGLASRVMASLARARERSIRVSRRTTPCETLENAITHWLGNRVLAPAT
jgi:hypothetical protein